MLKRVQFGQTDLQVTRYCQGTAFRHLERGPGNPEAERVIRHCLDVGVSFFDTAYAYGWGVSEELLGKVLECRRDQAVICTKVPASYPPESEGVAPKPASFAREYLSSQLEGALERLGTDYVDLYLLHQPDEKTPAGEVCESMDALVQSGKVRHWGVSNHGATAVAEYCALAQKAGTVPPVAIEDYYNVAAGYSLTPDGRSRALKLKQEMFPVVRSEGLGVIAFSPVDVGRLASACKAESRSPLADVHVALDEVADELGVTRAQVCAAWVTDHTEVTSVLSGAESPDHVDEMLAGAYLELPKEKRAKLDAASDKFVAQLEAARES